MDWPALLQSLHLVLNWRLERPIKSWSLPAASVTGWEAPAAVPQRVNLVNRRQTRVYHPPQESIVD